MELSMEEIIKDIIHIDKSANDLKKKMELDVKEKQKRVEQTVENLKAEIISIAKADAAAQKERELNEASRKADEILNKGKEKAKQMEDKFHNKKQDLIVEIFREII